MINLTLSAYVAQLPSTDKIDGDRKNLLNTLAKYIRGKLDKGESCNLNFICTHNSRRSHLAQVWATVAAHHHGIKGIKTYSGGTEVTALNHRVVTALEDAGFEIGHQEGVNPHYQIRYTQEMPPLVAYSKTFDDPNNPTSSFAAIMTCSHADENCPYVPGADERFALYYDDPKEADDTPEERLRYAERCREIATQMFYLMSKI